MPATRATLLCHYCYDALDRLIDHGLTDAPPLQRFYCKNRLTTEIQGALRQTLFQQGDWLLAQQTQQGIEHDTALLATDLQRSVLNTLKTNQAQPIAYAPYGHRRFISGWLSLMGFNGERPDPLTGHYLLGNGYRAFNPVLMRFNSPDSWSPFGKGGLNAYAYCVGDPINHLDFTGHNPFKISWSGKKSAFTRLFKHKKPEAEQTPKSFRQNMTIMGHRDFSPPKRRFSDPGPTTLPLTEPDFVGYHGTSQKSVINLLKIGVLPNRSKGFFYSPDKPTTYEYASLREYESTKANRFPIRPYGKSNIVEVHVRNLTSLQLGRDYDFNPYLSSYGTQRDSTEFFIGHHKHRSIEIRELGSTPATKKVRPRGHEAPF
jgi:RHS repeat-associated protein